MSSEPVSCLFSRHAPPALVAAGSVTVADFEFERTCGSGYLSTVSLVKHKSSGLKFALKAYNRRKLKKQEEKQIMREVENHLALDLHPNVVALYSVFFDPDNVYLLLELCAKGDLFQEIYRKNGRLNEQNCVVRVLAPFLRALQFLHSKNIVHRDIKPENLLFDEHGVLKLADFGLSINTQVERPLTRVGTLDYLSPEVMVRPDPDEPDFHQGGYDFSCDIWATGVLAFECLTGRAPFDRGRKQATVEAILKCEFELPAFLSDDAKQFIQAALSREPSERPSVEELYQFRFIQRNTRPTRGSYGSTAITPGAASLATSLASSPSVDVTRSPHSLYLQRSPYSGTPVGVTPPGPHARLPSMPAVLAAGKQAALTAMNSENRSAPSTVACSPAMPVASPATIAKPSRMSVAPLEAPPKQPLPASGLGVGLGSNAPALISATSSSLPPPLSGNSVPAQRIIGFGSADPSSQPMYTVTSASSLGSGQLIQPGSRSRIGSRTGSSAAVMSFTANNPPPELVGYCPPSPERMPGPASQPPWANVAPKATAASSPAPQSQRNVLPSMINQSISARNFDPSASRQSPSLKTMLNTVSDGDMIGRSMGSKQPYRNQVLVQPASTDSLELNTAHTIHAPQSTPVGSLKDEAGKGVVKLLKKLFN